MTLFSTRLPFPASANQTYFGLPPLNMILSIPDIFSKPKHATTGTKNGLPKDRDVELEYHVKAESESQSSMQSQG